MATVLTDTQIKVEARARLTSAGDLQSAESSLSWPRSVSYGYGAGLDQVDLTYTKTRSIVASGVDNIDLSGTLEDILGNGVVFARVKALAIYADPANAAGHNAVVGGATANGWVGPFGTTAHTLAVEPGGMLAFATRTAAGWAVANGASDILRVANGGTVSTISYQIVLYGAAS